MKRVAIAVSAAILGAIALPRAQQPAPSTPHAQGHVVHTAAMMKWGPAPPALPAGAEAAVLMGDPAQAAPFTVRLKFPDGYKIAPHWHPVDENVTVIQGTLMIGLGEKADATAMKDLTVGSFAVMPKETRHYAQAKGATVIQVNGIGPFEVNYVNPADDPRKKSGSY